MICETEGARRVRRKALWAEAEQLGRWREGCSSSAGDEFTVEVGGARCAGDESHVGQGQPRQLLVSPAEGVLFFLRALEGR